MTNVRDQRRNLSDSALAPALADDDGIAPRLRRFLRKTAKHAGIWLSALCLASGSANAQEGDYSYGRTPMGTAPSGSASGVVVDSNRQGMGVSIRGGHVAGGTVGLDQSASMFGLSPYVNIGNGMLFGDSRLTYANDGGLAWSFGGGYRQYIPAWDAVLGGNGYFDRDQITGAHFKQWSVGAELLAHRWEARGNYYRPFGTTSEQTGTRIDPNSAIFVGNNIQFNRIDTFAEALEGFDAEAGVLLPGDFSERIDLRAFGGGYYYQGEGLDGFSGFSTRLQADIGKWLELGLKLTNDDVFHTNVTFSAVLHTGSFSSQEHTRRSAMQRMAEPVRRNLNIAATTSDIVTGGQIANAADGTPLIVAHVNSAAGAGGTGAVDDPFNQLTSGLTFPDADVVFVHAGSSFNAPPQNIVNLADGQSLFGEGLIQYPTGIRQVVNTVTLDGIGDLTLPDSPTFASNLATFGQDTTNPLLLRPTLSSTIGDAVTMGNNSRFGGFILDSPTGNGITINAVNGTSVRDVLISNAGGSGIFVQNTFAGSTTTIVDTIIENATGPAFHVSGGAGAIGFTSTSSNLDPSFAAIINSSQEAVLIEDRVGGSVNMLGSTINDTGGTGIVIRGTGATPTTGNVTIDNASIVDSTSTGISITNASGNISFRNSVRGATTITNATGDSVLIDGLTAGSNVTFEDLNITSPLAGGINIDNMGGNFVFTRDLTIGAPGVGAVASPAISVANSLATGIVRFGGDVAILGSAGGGIEIDSNLAGSSFSVDGQLSVTSAAADSIAITNNGGTVQMNGGTLISQRGSTGILVTGSTGSISFLNGTTVLNDAAIPTIATGVDVNSSESLVLFENLTVDNALAGGGVSLVDNLAGTVGSGRIIFNDLNIVSVGGIGLFGNNNTSIRIDDGNITSTTAAAVNLANSGIDITFESINSTASPDFGISLVETNVEGLKTFQVLGDPTIVGFGTGGTIADAAIAGVNLANAGQVQLDSMTLDNNNFGFFIRNSGLTEDDDQFLSMQFTQVIDSTIRGIDSENLFGLNIEDSIFDNNGDTLLGLGGDGLPVTFLGRESIVLNYTERLNDVDTTLFSQFDSPYVVNIERTNFSDNTDDVIIVTNDALANGLHIDINIQDSTFTLNDTNDFDPTDLNESAFEMNWNGVARVNLFNNDVTMNGTDAAESQAAFVIDNNSFEDELILDITANTIPLSAQPNAIGISLQTDARASSLINNNSFQFNGESSEGMIFDLGTQNEVALLNNQLLFQNDGGTGMRFDMVSQPSVFTISGNNIGLTDLAVGTNEIGIQFRTVVGTPTLQGNLNNQIILLNPGFIGGGIGGVPANIEIDFTIPRANGQILINGALRP